ncbi:hypothetical protein NKI16_33815, partial [Mesorhizobium sp. M0698]
MITSPRNTAAGLLGPSKDEARVRLGPMKSLFIWLAAARRSSHAGRRGRSAFIKMRNKSRCLEPCLSTSHHNRSHRSSAWLRNAFIATALALVTTAPALAATDGGKVTDFL